MLLKLSISNFAIIKQLVFSPSTNLSILTGETGAGKSIVLDALSLILGSRADIKTHSEWGEKCVIEGVFQLSKNKYKPLFEALELDFEIETIIRREINVSGKSRTFINDTPVTLIQLKTIANKLVSIHSQHENTLLSNHDFQFQILDSFSKISNDLVNYTKLFNAYKIDENKLMELCKQQQLLLKEKDYLTYLAEEFEKCNLQKNEEELLEKELQILSNADNIEQVSNLIIELISEAENSIVNNLGIIKAKLKPLSIVSAELLNVYQRFDSSIIELKDLVADMEQIKANTLPNSNRLEEVNARLQLIQNLKRKHGVVSLELLLEEEKKLNEKLLSIGNIDFFVESLKNDLINQENFLKELAHNFHEKRLINAEKLEESIAKLLSKLEMPNARIKFQIEKREKVNEFGLTNLNILFTANMGMPLQPLNKVASGGELSRLALCFRSIEAEMGEMGTLIFDEIDTGVSGKVASNIGEMFKKLSAQHQILAITHLPQVAGYGHKHFMIFKKEENEKTISYIKELNKEERINELAAMLSGDKATEIAKQNAAELLNI